VSTTTQPLATPPPLGAGPIGPGSGCGPGPGGPGAPGPGGPGGPSQTSVKTVDSFTNDIGAYVAINTKKICWYQEYYVPATKLHSYHILSSDGKVACIQERNQDGGITLDTTGHTLVHDTICKWKGYIIGTLYPGD